MLLTGAIVLGATVLMLAACGEEESTSSEKTGPSKTSVIAVAGGANQDALTAVSPDGKSVVLDPGDGNAIRDIAWSSDGKWIAFTRFLGGQKSNDSALFLYDVAGKKSTQVLLSADQSSQVLDFAWVSPTQVVLSAYVGVTDIFRVNAGIYLCDAPAQTVAPLNGPDGAQIMGLSLSATADGKTVVFTQYGKEPGGKKMGGMIDEFLVLLDVGSKSLTTIAKGQVGTMDEGDAFANPAISPDGTLIFTEQTGSDPGFGATIYGADGSKKWTSEPMQFPSRAAWDPKGEKVVFGGIPAMATDMKATVNVWDANSVQASELTTLVDGYLDSLAWSPDGAQIAAVAGAMGSDESALWVMDADGSGAKKLLAAGGPPSWGMAAIDFSAATAPTGAGSPSP